MVFVCGECNKTFSSSFNLRRHKENIHAEPQNIESEPPASSIATEERMSDSDGADEDEQASDMEDEESDENESSDQEQLAPFWEELKKAAEEKYIPRIRRLAKEYQEDDYQDEEAFREAYNEMLPRIRAELNKLLLHKALLCEEFCEDSIIEEIKNKKRKFGGRW